ncbi:hypothetical protein ABW19_dt0205788 [Dactylella cylindrospora]|nr:hypothetical protein ABW19_dt0205788 [Dactylella cylindrospora]
MDRYGDHPSMEEYVDSNPYVTDPPEIIPDMTVADGYFGGGNRPHLSSNPYITNTTEAIPDMVVSDGYFNGRPHQQLPMIHLADEEPVKTAMPEPPNPSDTREQEAPPRPSQDDDAQTLYSRVSFLSERSTLPPSYSSRRHSYEDEERAAQEPQTTEMAPLVGTECNCQHPQCITCVANGRARPLDYGRRFWKKKFKCSRNCSNKKKLRKFRFCCSFAIILILTWSLFGGLFWRHASHRFRESLEYYESIHCRELLPGTYEDSLTLPMNGSLSAFALKQAVVYEKEVGSAKGQVHVDGYINVEHASESDEVEQDEVVVKVEYQVSDESVLQDIDIRLTETGAGIFTNRYPQHSDLHDVCVFFKVTVKFPKSASVLEIKQFLIDTEQLSVQLKPSLSLKVLDKAILNSVTGNIWSKARQPSKIQDDERRVANFGLQAKNLLIGTTTGNIRGVWGLADYASFESKSGNVDIGVMSLTSLPEMGDTTELIVSTVSGDAAVHSVSNDGTLHPFRKNLTAYNTKIKTISGDIIGQYLLGSYFSAQTISGYIEADILPISPAIAGSSNEHSITIETDNKSGKTKVAFLEATDAKVLTEPKSLLRMRKMQTVIGWLDEKRKTLLAFIQKHCEDKEGKDLKAGKADISESANDIEPLYVDPADTGLASLAFFKATHVTVSGDVFIHYPVEFEGSIKATSLTGDIEIGGEDVKVVRNERNGPVGRIVEAVHGAKDSGIVDTQSLNGDIRICVGDARW